MIARRQYDRSNSTSNAEGGVRGGLFFLKHSLAPVEVGTGRVGGERLLQGSRVAIQALLGHREALLALRHVGASADGREKINEEGKYVSGEDKGNGPFQDGRGVFPGRVLALRAGHEGNGEGDFDNDKGQLDDEADQQDAMLRSVEDTQTVVLAAEENGTDDVSHTGEKGQPGDRSPGRDGDGTYMKSTKKPSCRFG